MSSAKNSGRSRQPGSRVRFRGSWCLVLGFGKDLRPALARRRYTLEGNKREKATVKSFPHISCFFPVFAAHHIHGKMLQRDKK